MTIIALWLCFQGVGCRYEHGPYISERACIIDRDLFNHKARVGAWYECWGKPWPQWVVIDPPKKTAR